MNAKLLGTLVQSAPYVILSETMDIYRVLSSFLSNQFSMISDYDHGSGAYEKDNSKTSSAVDMTLNMQNGIVTAILQTVGYVAEMTSTKLKESDYLEKLLGLTIRILKMKTSEQLSLEAVNTLGKVICYDSNHLKT